MKNKKKYEFENESKVACTAIASWVVTSPQRLSRWAVERSAMDLHFLDTSRGMFPGLASLVEAAPVTHQFDKDSIESRSPAKLRVRRYLRCHPSQVLGMLRKQLSRLTTKICIQNPKVNKSHPWPPLQDQPSVPILFNAARPTHQKIIDSVTAQ